MFPEIASDFEALFGRELSMVESYHTEDAEIVLVMIGSFATKARDAVDRLRGAGYPVGLVRPCLIRPFPADRIRKLLAGKQGVAVIDQNLSPGMGGLFILNSYPHSMAVRMFHRLSPVISEGLEVGTSLWKSSARSCLIHSKPSRRGLFLNPGCFIQAMN